MSKSEHRLEMLKVLNLQLLILWGLWAMLVVAWGGGKGKGLFLLSVQKSFFLRGFLGYKILFTGAISTC